VLLATFAVFLHLYSSQQEIVLGSPVSGRTRSRWSGLPGYLINQIVYRMLVSHQESFRALLAQVRELVAAGLAHQDYPLALVAEDLQPERDPAYPPMFQVMFSFQQAAPGHDPNIVALALNEPGPTLDFDNTTIEAFPLPHETTQLDLTLAMAQVGAELVASIQYNAGLFDRSTVARMADHLRALLQDVVLRPDSRVEELQIMSEAEKSQLLFDWNGTGQEYARHAQIHALFSMQALAQGDRIAVIGGGEQLTFLELEQNSNQLARHLRSKGIGPGDIVGLFIERRASLMTGILGILKTGAAYLPLDPVLPDERCKYMVADAKVQVVVTQQVLSWRFQEFGVEAVCVDACPEIVRQSATPLELQESSDHLAYVMYTSGSTGKPKGVMVTHRGVVNFFHAMDERISCSPQDTLLAVTGISFDISVLELLWTLTRGVKVVLADPLSVSSQPGSVCNAAQELDYSLFYFASADEQNPENKYELLLEGAKYADQNGFAAVWTPERHFHPFGGLYPNPAVTDAALAATTRRLQIRAGSVVLPLHSVIRVAEEWSVVDNLSAGRTGLAFASGWHADDFVFAPHLYPDRKELMFQAIETFLKLWRGEAVTSQSGSGKEINVRIFPRPRQQRPPLWITAAGTPDTFVRAGEIGANILTHLLGQTVEDVAEKVKLYRNALQKHGHDPEAGKVTLMLHTFLGDHQEKVKDQVRAPFTSYLGSSVDLIRNLARSANLPLNFDDMSSKDMQDLLAFAFERYFESSALFGTVKSCQPMIEKLRAIGVNEIACLIDFGIENQAALQSLRHVNSLKNACVRPPLHVLRSVAELAKMYRPSMMQCTPAVLKMVSAGAGGLAALGSLHTLMVGGESLPPVLAREIKESLNCRLINMYGPTETTIWSSTAEVPPGASTIDVGKPISNTTMYVLDRNSSLPVPTAGAARGAWWPKPNIWRKARTPASW
jgi:natural product biosynthesis luciferase-like monooxygenase protein